jgi:hypothetical protein
VKRSDSRSAFSLIGAALAASLVAFLVGGFGGYGWSNPPSPKISWDITFWFAILGIGLAAAARANPKNEKVTKGWAEVSVFFALLGTWGPIYSYYGNYHTYPWAEISLLWLLSIPIGFLSGMRVTPIMSLAFSVYWLYGAFLPVEHRTPIVQRSQGLECKLISVERGYCRFELKDLAGRELNRSIDPRNIELEGQVGPVISVQTWRARTYPESSTEFLGHAFPPRWAKSWDLQIRVPRLHSKAAASVVVPLTSLPKQTLTDQSAGYKLSVTVVGWTSSSSIPSQRCLGLKLAYSGVDYGSGFSSGDFRLIDDQGRLVPSYAQSTSRGNTYIEAYPIEPGARELRVELQSSEHDQRSTTVFRFDRVSTGW